MGFPNLCDSLVPNTILCDSLELTNVEDEGEQIGGEKNQQLTKLSEQIELKWYFNKWKDLADLGSKHMDYG